MEALKESRHSEAASKPNVILIADVTAAADVVRSHFGTWGFGSKSKATPGKDTVVDFEKKARSSCRLNPQFDNEKSYKVIPEAELDKVFKGGDWPDF